MKNWGQLSNVYRYQVHVLLVWAFFRVFDFLESTFRFIFTPFIPPLQKSVLRLCFFIFFQYYKMKYDRLDSIRNKLISFSRNGKIQKPAVKEMEKVDHCIALIFEARASPWRQRHILADTSVNFPQNYPSPSAITYNSYIL